MTAFLKVNGDTIDIAAAVRQSLLHNGTFLRDTLRVSLIRQYAEKQNIRNSDAELQLAVDEVRYSRGPRIGRRGPPVDARVPSDAVSLQNCIDRCS